LAFWGSAWLAWLSPR